MEQKKKKKKNKVRRVALDIIIICLAGVVAFSGYKLYKMHRDYKVGRDIYNKIAETAMPQGFNGEIDFDSLRETNSDIVAWLYYEGTNINYPIVQGSDNDYYLHITFEGTWAIGGTLFVDAITEDPFNQFNTIVYGHHMKDHSMFGDLQELKDIEYAKEHPQFELITPEGKYHLRVCAFLNEPSDSEVYTTNYHDDAGKQKYIDLIKSSALYVTDEEMTPDDRLVVLSTCAYEYKNARYMVIGKMIPWE